MVGTLIRRPPVVSDFMRTVLDDTTAAAARTTLGYEEGFWNPVVTFSTPGTSSFTYSAQGGAYIRWGNIVLISVNLNFTPTIGTGSGEVRISLPLAGASAGVGGVDTMAVKNASAGFTWPASTTMMTFVVSSGVAYGRIFSEGPAITAGALQTTNLTGGTATQIEFGGSYRTA